MTYSANSAPNAANGRPGENRDRVDEALVQNPEDDVDDEDRDQQQDPHALLRILERLRRAREPAGDRRRKHFRATRSTSAVAAPSETPGARLNEIVIDAI